MNDAPIGGFTQPCASTRSTWSDAGHADVKNDQGRRLSQFPVAHPVNASQGTAILKFRSCTASPRLPNHL
jgi:hypothetical protein